MDMQTLQTQSVKELNQTLVELSKNLFNYRMQHAGGNLTRTHVLTVTKRDIARVQTVLSMKRNEGQK